MIMRTLGPNGPRVSSVGLGCMGFSEFYTSSAASEWEAIAVIQSGLALGLNFLDTADIYGPWTKNSCSAKRSPAVEIRSSLRPSSASSAIPAIRGTVACLIPTFSGPSLAL